MTQQQALARYGEPKTRSITDKGEVWVYLLNYGEVLGKAFISFNFKVTPVRTGAHTFGSNGKVKEFRWDAETNGYAPPVTGNRASLRVDLFSPAPEHSA
jgi:hypothetical protein